MRHGHRWIPAAAVALIVAGCATFSERNPELEAARAALESAQRDPAVVSYAPNELARASEAYRRADNAARDRRDAGEVDHLAYIARQRTAIAVETAHERTAQNAVEAATRERDRVQLEARTREAARAQAEANAAMRNAE